MVLPGLALVLGPVLGAAAIGCGGDDDVVEILAASSFTDVADVLEPLIESETDLDVRFSFGSSGSFFEQLRQGAPASVVITANDTTMERIEEASLVDPSVPISRNELIIVTADTDAGRSIAGLDDLAAPDVVVVLCTSSAPCGEASDAALALAGVDVSPASREPNVRATLTKVTLGEADAALVYRTDALAAPDLRAVEIPAGQNVVVTGRAAAIAGDERGGQVVDVLVGPIVSAALSQAGFLTP
jgi:molybdate transport system substrate-binding protein